MRQVLALASLALACGAPASAAPPQTPPLPGPSGAVPAAASPAPTMADVLAASTIDDWRVPAPENTVYLELGPGPGQGRVVLELAPLFAPRHVDNVRALVRAGYFDHAFIVRVQENYVVQWSDPDGTHPLGAAARTLPGEFERSAAGLDFTPLPDPDTFAPEVGFASGFPTARDPRANAAWLVHCYGMLGAGRDNAADSGGGTELYVVTGHAPRQLDRNVTLLGRVLSGMERLTTLPRGSAALGFYEKPEQRIPITRVRIAADLPEPERSAIEILRTDTATFRALVEARRNRREPWFLKPAGHIDLCNVPLVVRTLSR